MFEPPTSNRPLSLLPLSRMRPLATGAGCAVLLTSLLGTSPAGAQAPGGQAQPGQAQPGQAPVAAEDAEGAAAPASPRQVYKDPYSAYEAGAYDQALQRFVDAQVERPEDPALALNTGSVHYQMKNYAEADKAFSSAALSGDPEIRQQALYNLGNSAFRQGKLEEAVDLYKTVLDLNPDDEDAKFNLEFVRNEIRRRHEEAQKRQEEQQGQQGENQQQQQDQQQQDQQGGDQQQQQDSSQSGGQDQDQDGLPDETERSADNPTDPANPDTDGDQIPDGQEDSNRNGRVDPGETDPNNQDTDGDGIPDAQDPQPTEGQQQDPQNQDEQGGEQQPQGGQAQEAGQPEGLTEEEAERYLQALEEGTPDSKKAPQRGRRSRQAKDW